MFHIDHVVPRSARGKTMLSNLALACVSCSLRKAARLTATDPETSREMPLFNPRREIWNVIRQRHNRNRYDRERQRPSQPQVRDAGITDKRRSHPPSKAR